MFCRSAVFSVSSLSHWCLPSVPLAPTLLVVCNATMQCDILPITTVYVSWNYTRCLFKILWEDGGASVISYHSGLATRSEGYGPVYGPLSELLESWQPWGAEHDICDLEVDSWIRWYLVSVPEDYPDTLTWHLWNMDKHNDNDGIKIKTKIIVSMHKYIKISCSYHRIHIPSHYMLPFPITIIIKFVCICWSWTRRRIHRNVDNTQ